jgi:SAM-dependent methyltransferase
MGARVGVWADWQYVLLKTVYKRSPDVHTEETQNGRSKLWMLGNDIQDVIAGKSIIDFGCGEGNEAIEMARRGASRVMGVDIREDQLETARRRAAAAGVTDRCLFLTTTSEAADIITTIDAFEHFEDPAAILQIMFSLLKPGGEVLFSFGRTWFHPLGGHLFSVFPWAHVLFSEEALIRWRSDFKDDGARRFHEVAGGLNQMTIQRFERFVVESGFQMERFECVPIRKLKPLHNHMTREFTTAVCRGRLKKAA